MSRFTNPVPQFFRDNGELASSGRMYFYENKNYSLLKSTFSQPDNTVANTNPLKLDGQGRLPNCFGEGLYSVKLYAANPDNPNIDGELIWTRDDVDLSAGGDAAFSEWSPVQTYGTGSIVKDGEPYYRLYGSAASKGEQPSLTPSKWEEIVFITGHIAGRSYPEDYIVKKDGYLYRSNTADNTTTPPSADWENLTFNNSVTGDFSVGGDLDVADNIQIGLDSGTKTFIRFDGKMSSDGVTYYDIATSDRLSITTLGGTFTGGQIDLVKIGDVVTITVKVGLAHASSSSVSSDSGGIPSKYRPTANTEMTIINGVGFDKVTVQTAGNIQITHLDSSFASINRTSCPFFTISYVV